MSQKILHNDLDISKDLADLAEEVIQTFREENPDTFTELLKVYDKKSADIAILGCGKLHLSIQNGKVQVEPGMLRGTASTIHSAFAPETLIAILEEQLSPLDAYFRGELIARANSAEIHVSYDYFLDFLESMRRSKMFQIYFDRFKKLCKVRKEP